MAEVGLTAAEQRRELRRQRILARSDDRLKKITGVSEPTVTFADEAPSLPLCEDYPFLEDSAPHTPSRCHTERPLSTPIFNFVPNGDATPDLSSLANAFLKESPEAAAPFAATSAPVARQAPSDYLSFVRWRCVMCIILGVLVRLSFCTEFGLNYVQSIFNPFMAWEIAVIGYQRALGMNMNRASANPLLTMALSQIKPEILATYRTIAQIMTSVTTDFAFFFFAFVVLNIFL
ncbi:hypothetical protein CAPTEDRAFT_220528 [Capitella teleta]|uniref:Calcium signal-modulating cyclophilin ligand n=1 Tax=Capitella teleta TaxID=283909 RepID=R7U163_CAPTE|nr:hypothetical protein CAPTEDRAFT_220528 [Capitella teleta]|eukprot:ELT97376.1 hypothetical protein CAPTEDRAFT_220528 [Capitella teleta]